MFIDAYQVKNNHVFGVEFGGGNYNINTVFYVCIFAKRVVCFWVHLKHIKNLIGGLFFIRS